jgi:hypothetical protein
MPLLVKYLCSTYYIIYGILQVVSEHFPRYKIVVYFLFRVETYYNVLKLHRFFIMCINPQLRGNTCRKYKWYLSTHLLDTLITNVGTPLSHSASDNTCI